MSATQRSTPEGQVAAALIKAVEARGGFIRKLRWEGRVGAPDYLIAFCGAVYFVETKAPGKKVRPSQAAEFRRLGEAGVHVLVLDSVDRAEVLAEALSGWGSMRVCDFFYTRHV